jgi:hypothetical protein
METVKMAITNEWIMKMYYVYRMVFYSATKKNEIFSFASKRMELENITLTKVSQLRRAKILCYPSYMGFRCKTHAVILLGMGHTLRGECIQEECGKVGNPKLKSV